MVNWQPIIDKVNEHGYMSGIDRMSDRVKKTGEIFTPTNIVIKMIEKSGIDKYGPGKIVLDPACGDGQMLVTAKWLKILHFGMTEKYALNELYGVDIMRDNVDLCKNRLGGGHVFMGDFLNPNLKLDEQTDIEHEAMIANFGSQTLPI